MAMALINSHGFWVFMCVAAICIAFVLIMKGD